MESVPKKRKPRAPMRQTTLTVMKILKLETKKDKPITITELVRKLKIDFDISVTRDSVKRILNDLMEFMPGPDKICCSEHAKRDGSEYTSRYYYQLYQASPREDISSTVQKVIQHNNNLAGDQITTLSFWLNGYGSDHNLHHLGKKYSWVEPQKIITANGHDYLVCLLRNQDRLFHFRLDLITELDTQEIKKTDRKTLENIAKNQDYQTNHPGMFYDRKGENPVHIGLKIRKIPQAPNASLTFLQDTFGDNWKAIGTETEKEVTIFIYTTPSVAAQFVWQYWNRVTVIESDVAGVAVVEELRCRYKTLSKGFPVYT